MDAHPNGWERALASWVVLGGWLAGFIVAVKNAPSSSSEGDSGSSRTANSGARGELKVGLLATSGDGGEGRGAGGGGGGCCRCREIHHLARRLEV